MAVKLPTLAVLLGVGGLVPFIGCAMVALSVSEPAATFWLQALIAYGAVILSFLGGVHWGLALSDPDAREQNRLRFGLGVLASLIGWAALLSMFLIAPEIALAILIAGFSATVLTETRLKRLELLPGGYLWLRWALSVVVVTILVAVLLLRLLGAHIVPA